MSPTVVRPAYADPTPLSRALKGLAKVHALPPFRSLYGRGTAAAVVVAPEDAEAWRRALGAPPLAEGSTSAFWLGVKVEIIAGEVS